MAQPVRLRARVDQVIDHAPGLRSLELVPERPVPRFRPGQFLHLALDPWDPSRHWPDSRPLSIASPPESRHRVRVTVSEVGRFTARLTAVDEGDEVWLKLPYGEFVVGGDDGTPAVLVGGGTGVAPFVSLAVSDRNPATAVRLLYGARRPDLLIYRDALDEAARRNPNFTWTAFVDDSDPTGAHHGRLSVEAILEEAETMSHTAEAVIYLSGPPAMITDLTAGLHGAGIPGHRIRVDAWA